MNHHLNSINAELIFMLETPTHWRMSPDALTFAETFDSRLCRCPLLIAQLNEPGKLELFRMIDLLNEGQIQPAIVINWIRTLLVSSLK